MILKAIERFFLIVSRWAMLIVAILCLLRLANIETLILTVAFATYVESSRK